MNNVTERQMIFNALSSYFANDPDRYVVAKVPFIDGLGRRRYIDFAVISRNSKAPRVAILVQPPCFMEANDMSQKEAEICVSLLGQQNWIPVVYSANDLLNNFQSIGENLGGLVYPNDAGAKGREKTANTRQVKLYPLSAKSQKLLARA